MSHLHFEELREWSGRKHELLTKYLDGFVRILGGSTSGLVYYVDGFAGPGQYGDNAKGSPLLAAEYAHKLVGKHYQLHCINVEVADEHFQNLEANTSSYASVVTNFHGSFGSHVDYILKQVSNRPAIFFLDPFGLKGIEWQSVSKVVKRSFTTELLIRVSPTDLQRLAGNIDSDSPSAAGKQRLVTQLYGFTDSQQWEDVWRQQGADGLFELYLNRLKQEATYGQKSAYVYRYPIRTIDGFVKYYLVFVTKHPKGAVLMNDIVYGAEANYERDVAEYNADQPIQLELWETPKPSKEEIFQNKVDQLKHDLAESFRGKSPTLLELRHAMLDKWFGEIKGPHFTRALKQMKRDGQIISRSGRWSDHMTMFAFES